MRQNKLNGKIHHLYCDLARSFKQKTNLENENQKKAIIEISRLTSVGF